MENERVLDAVKQKLGPAEAEVTPANEVKSFVIEVAGKRMHLKLPAGLVATAQAAAQATGMEAPQATEKPKQRLRGRRANGNGAGAKAPEGADAVSPILQPSSA